MPCRVALAVLALLLPPAFAAGRPIRTVQVPQPEPWSGVGGPGGDGGIPCRTPRGCSPLYPKESTPNPPPIPLRPISPQCPGCPYLPTTPQGYFATSAPPGPVPRYYVPYPTPNPSVTPPPVPTRDPDTSPPGVCTDSCATAGNGVCEDGGIGASASHCVFGSDCTDCGFRTIGSPDRERREPGLGGLVVTLTPYPTSWWTAPPRTSPTAPPSFPSPPNSTPLPPPRTPQTFVTPRPASPTALPRATPYPVATSRPAFWTFPPRWPTPLPTPRPTPIPAERVAVIPPRTAPPTYSPKIPLTPRPLAGTPGPSSSPSSGYKTAAFVLIAIIALAVAAVVGLFIFLRQKKRKEPTQKEAAPPPPRPLPAKGVPEPLHPLPDLYPSPQSAYKFAMPDYLYVTPTTHPGDGQSPLYNLPPPKLGPTAYDGKSRPL